jgi:hypothetical protein
MLSELELDVVLRKYGTLGTGKSKIAHKMATSHIRFRTFSVLPNIMRSLITKAKILVRNFLVTWYS